MRIAATATKSESSNIINNAAMGVGDSSKIYRILIEGLYKDPIGSVVREIVSNAIDSHIEAGCTDRTVVVTAPSQFDSRFIVRDFGVSMTPDQIDKVFRMLTMSTKDDRDDLIGAFGLGSKTPLAYSDAFTLTTFIDGFKRVYSIFMDEGDIPNINLMFEGESDEEQGVEVCVPVRDRDVNRFHHAINEQLFFFSHPIEVSNLGGGFEFTQFNPTNTEHGIQYGEANDSISSGVYIVQGGVGYRLDNNFVNNLDGDDDNDRDIIDFIGSISEIAAIEFDIGSIDVPSTRENVKYTQRTLDNIRDVIGKAVSNIRDNVASHVIKGTEADCDNLVDTAKSIGDFINCDQLSNASGFERKMVGSQIRKNLREFSDIVKGHLGVGVITRNVFDSSGDVNVNFVGDFLQVKEIPVKFVKYVRNHTTGKLKKESVVTFVNHLINGDEPIYVHNAKKSPIMRVDEFASSESGTDIECAVLVLPKGGFSIDSQVEDKIKKWFPYFFKNLHFIDDLPMPKRVSTRQVTKNPRFFTRNLDGSECVGFETNSIKDLIDDYGDDYKLVLIPRHRGDTENSDINPTITYKAMYHNIIVRAENNNIMACDFLNRRSNELKNDYMFVSVTVANVDKILSGRYGSNFSYIYSGDMLEKIFVGFEKFTKERISEKFQQFYLDGGNLIEMLRLVDYGELRTCCNDLNISKKSISDSVVQEIIEEIDGIDAPYSIENKSHIHPPVSLRPLEKAWGVFSVNAKARDLLESGDVYGHAVVDEIELLIGETLTKDNLYKFVKDFIKEIENKTNDIISKCKADLSTEIPGLLMTLVAAKTVGYPNIGRIVRNMQGSELEEIKKILQRHV